MIDPTRRFTSRVDNYLRYRPGYPAAVLSLLEERCALTDGSVVADVGSGTGTLSELFLRNGNTVYAIEPNGAMRTAGERLLRRYPRFVSVPASAERTTLPDRSVDLITAAQAFHWFDRDRARSEFRRILRPGGRVVIIWNDRRTHATPFLAAYELLLETCASDYRQVDHKRLGENVIRAFYGGGPQLETFYNEQVLGLAELEGRLASSSYCPEVGAPGHDEMVREARRIFHEHQVDGKVTIEYDTLVYYGRLE